MSMLEFETLGIDRIKVDLAAQYVDHNLRQTDFKNADDHKFLRTACAHYGSIILSRSTASPILSTWNVLENPDR